MSLIAEPQLAVIRTERVGVDFYARVMDRIAKRQRKPRGVLLHLAGTNANELFVVTVYRDALSRADLFRDFSGPEIINELRESGISEDIGRDEFEVVQIQMATDFEQQAQRPLATPRFAFLFIDGQITPSIDAQSTEQLRLPELWPEELDTHIVFREREQLGRIDIWRSQEAAEQHYGPTLPPSAAIELAALTNTIAADDPMRSFLKAGRGATG